MSKLNTHSPNSKHPFIGESVRHSLAGGAYLFNKKMKEIWKEIKGYEGVYQVSNLGRVRGLSRIVKQSCEKTARIKGKEIATQVTNAGYTLVHLSKDGKRKAHTVHRLVAINFLLSDISQLSMQVDHLDNDKTNNSVLNLEFVTHKENIRRAWENGLHEKTRKRASEILSVVSTRNAKANGLRISGLSYSKIIITDIQTGIKAEYGSFREASRATGFDRKQMAVMEKLGKPYKGKTILWEKTKI